MVVHDSAVLLVVAIGALLFRRAAPRHRIHRRRRTDGPDRADHGLHGRRRARRRDSDRIDDAAEPRVVVVNDESVRVQTGSLTAEETTTIRDAVAAELGLPSEEITAQVIGPSWGPRSRGRL